MIKGWIIHKETAFAPRIAFLKHTHSTAQRWSLPVPIALAILPNGLRAEPSQSVSNSCPSKDFQEETKEYVARNPSFSATMSLKFFVTKWVVLNVSLKLASGRPPQESSRTHGSCQNSYLKTHFKINTCRRLSPKNYAGVTGNYAGVTTRHSLAILRKTLRF